MLYKPPETPTIAENFPDRFADLYKLVTAEVHGLTPQQLDFNSNRWRWAQWSIRRQLGHMASVFSSWLLGIWGNRLFPTAPGWYEPVATIHPTERWAYFGRGHADDIVHAVHQGIALAEDLMARETPETMRDKRRVSLNVGRGWIVMARAHHSGLMEDPSAPGLFHLDLEATLRQCYFEQTTHLFNVQRLKRAQGLPTHADIPFEGFFALDGWDRSEPDPHNSQVV